MMKYARLVKLNAPVYGSSNYLRCESVYHKGEGYYIEIDPVEFRSGLVAHVFCKEYFALGDAGKFLIMPASRRSSKKQAEADTYMETNLADFVDKYLKRIGRNDLHIAEE